MRTLKRLYKLEFTDGSQISAHASKDLCTMRIDDSVTFADFTLEPTEAAILGLALLNWANKVGDND